MPAWTGRSPAWGRCRSADSHRFPRPHGTTFAQPTAQPDSHVGPPGPHGRLDRPPARGDRPQIDAFKREHELVPDERGRRAPTGARSTRARPARRGRCARSPPSWRPSRGRRAPRRRRARPRSRSRRGRPTTTTTRTTTRGAAAPPRAPWRPRTRAPRRAGPLEGTFDHGEEGYGLWLDPAVAGQRRLRRALGRSPCRRRSRSRRTRSSSAAPATTSLTPTERPQLSRTALPKPFHSTPTAVRTMCSRGTCGCSLHHIASPVSPERTISAAISIVS